MQLKKAKEGFLPVWILLAVFFVLIVVVLALYFISAAGLPDNVGRILSEEEQIEVIERNSPLTEYVYLTKNADFPRNGKIEKITIHHMAGNFSLERLGDSFAQRDRRVSANYGIDSNGRIALYVEEGNRAWTSSNKDNDDAAVTIEVANDQIGTDWHVSDAAYEALIRLCVDICKRNDIPELVFTGDAEGNLTLHSMFYKETECPGPYLTSRMPDIVNRVNLELKSN
ncbi:peptidoglycan recognition protein family protein [Ihubacter sp. rT4E-8]|uniref:peptidoglycan recognition protein family protein n=1 Tax=Ihubacter sp. rT4E-8 TaxID=3242369 RepID=UPI003CE8CC13